MWDGAAAGASVCLVLSLSFGALGLGSVCAHLHGCVLLKLPDSLCKDTVPNAGAVSVLSPRAGCPCLHAYLRVTGCAAMLIDMLLGIVCATSLSVPISVCALAWAHVWSWYAYITTSMCIEMTEPMQASMSCSSFSLVR